MSCPETIACLDPTAPSKYDFNETKKYFRASSSEWSVLSCFVQRHFVTGGAMMLYKDEERQGC